MASGSSDHTIKIWDLVSGDCLFTLTGHILCVYKMAELSGNRLVSFSADRTIRLWDLETGQNLKIIKCETQKREKQSIGSIKVLPNEILLCGRGKLIDAYDLNKGVFVKSLVGHSDSVQCVDILSDGRIVSAAWDRTIKVWNLNSGQCKQTIMNAVHSGSVLCMLVLANDILVTGSDETCYIIKVWDLRTKKLVKTLIGHQGIVSCLSSISDDKICSGSWDGTIKIWNLTSTSCLQTFYNTGIVYSLECFSN